MVEAGRVLPRLFIGGAPASPGDLAHLRRRWGISVVLSLQTDADLAAAGLSWREVDAWCRAHGLLAQRVPMEDWSAQAVLAHMDQAVQALQQLLEAGHTVYLHCTAGVNRSPSIALAYLRRVAGEPLDSALARITSVRPQASPYADVVDALR